MLALVAVSALAILSLACLHMAATVTRSENGRIDRSLAFYVAEGGLAEAYAGLGSVRSPGRAPAS